MLRNREGFTLIELLIVVVIIGILAAIAIPKFSQTREKAYESAMQSDLRNLQTEMEMVYSANTGEDAYTYTLPQGWEFQTSKGVGFPEGGPTVSETGQGWSAVVSHTATTVRCAVFVGDAEPEAPATEPGVVTCAEPDAE